MKKWFWGIKTDLWSNPWIYFLLLTLVNALLSYGPFSLTTQLSLFFLVFIPIFTLAYFVQPHWKQQPSSPVSDEFLPAIPWSVVLLLSASAVVLRFFRLTTLSEWPLVDEARSSLFAMHQAQQWDWKLLYGYHQLPPFYYWLFALFYKAIPPSLFSLWLFPAFLSTAILGLGYWTARSFFSKSFSLLATGLLAFSFWPLYAGRFAAEGLLVLFWELLCLGLLGQLHRKTTPHSQRNWAMLLGIGVGFGFYVHLHWLVVSLLLLLAFLGTHLPRSARISFLIPFGLLPLPLFHSMLTASYGGYLQTLLPFGKNGESWISYLYTSGSFLTSLFWGVKVYYFAYKPFWGGFLNPLLNAFFLLGLIDFLKSSGWKDIRRWILFAFPVFLIPAFLTNNLETFRIIQVLPLLLVVTARGVQVLLRVSAGVVPWKKISALLLLSLALDLYHLVGAYSKFWDSHFDEWSAYSKDFNTFQAYNLLNPFSQKHGPGLFFQETPPHLGGQAWVTAAHPFNKVINPSLPTAHWAAILCDENFRSFLSSRFPMGRYKRMGFEDEPLSASLIFHHPIGLFLIPLPSGQDAFFDQWIKEERLFLQIAFEDENLPPGVNHDSLVQEILSRRQNFQKDPLLSFLFFKKLASLYEEDNKPEEEWDALRQALRAGFPQADLYYHCGVLAVRTHHWREAAKAYREAGRLNPQFLPPPEIFEKLLENSRVNP